MTKLQTLSIGTRIASALAVVGFVSAAWMAMGHESERAVTASAAAMGPRAVYVTLPSVEIVGQRESTSQSTALAAAGLTRATNEL